MWELAIRQSRHFGWEYCVRLSKDNILADIWQWQWTRKSAIKAGKKYRARLEGLPKRQEEIIE